MKLGWTNATTCTNDLIANVLTIISCIRSLLLRDIHLFAHILKNISVLIIIDGNMIEAITNSRSRNVVFEVESLKYCRQYVVNSLKYCLISKQSLSIKCAL